MDRDRYTKFRTIPAFMDSSRDDVLAYMSFPREHWVQIASTNPLERVNREIKRRADVVGIFPNTDSIQRLIGAVLLEANDEWQLQHRYMQIEGMAGFTPSLLDDTLTAIPPQAA